MDTQNTSTANAAATDFIENIISREALEKPRGPAARLLAEKRRAVATRFAGELGTTPDAAEIHDRLVSFEKAYPNSFKEAKPDLSKYSASDLLAIGNGEPPAAAVPQGAKNQQGAQVMNIVPKTKCSYQQFIDHFPPEYRYSLAHILRLSREGRFPRYTKPLGQRSVALFEVSAILEHSRTTFGAFSPVSVSNLETAFGVAKPKKKERRNV